MLRDLPSSMKAPHRMRHGTHQDAHANLVIRDLEPITLVAAADVISSPQPGQYTKLPNAQILVVSHQAEDTSKHGITSLGSDSHLSVEAAVNFPALDTSDRLVRAVLKHYASNDGYVPFKTHVSWYIGLVTTSLSSANHIK